MITVLLYGFLAKRFGKYHRMNVSSPGEAVRALSANFPGFERAMSQYKGGFHVFRGKENLGADKLREPSSRDAIRIVPAIAGAKANGVLQIIEGIVIMIAAVVYGAYTWDFVTADQIFIAGALMTFGGVVTLLFSPPATKKSPDEKANNQPSYVFNGPVNTTAQGHPVPVGYGRLRVGSAVISGGIFVSQIDATTGADDIGAMRVGPTLVGVGV